ncbi:cytochrome P450 3A8-like [Liolophura sinensis]|uniref:cytochrome P450 3A8-like n=1 Tax=Liolophura sinensis TaxID=3198878 RepID=UPI0031593A42
MGLTDVVSWVPAWLGYLIAFILLIYLYGVWPYLTSQIRLPGPKPTVFFGNLIEVYKHGVIPTDMSNLKKYGRVYMSWTGRIPTIYVSDPDLVKQICVKEFQNFPNRAIHAPLSPLQRSMITSLKDDHWKFVRSVLSPAFSSGKMRKMVPLIQICIDRLIENLGDLVKKQRSIDIKPVMEGLTMEVIGAVGFGIETNVQNDLNDRFLIMARRVFQVNSLTKIPVILTLFFPFMRPIFEALNMTADSGEVMDFFAKMVKHTIQERRQQPSPRKDLLQVILDSSVDDLKETVADRDVDVDALKMDGVKRKTLTDKEVIAQSLVFLLAGFESTATAVSHLLYSLAIYPECQDKLVEEIDEALKGGAPTYDNVMKLPYLEKCLCEAQRLYPAIRGNSRMSREAITINGIYIPANTSVMLMGYALQHDETYWPDPEKFDPERWSPEQKAARHPYVSIPFGAGPRNCVGMRLAQLEAKMSVVAMLQRFRFIRAPDTEVPLKMKKGSFLLPENGIRLRIESREK